jgi:two-component system, chemotaxis family, chemotaxis protein CheY
MSSSGEMRQEPPAVGAGRTRPVILVVDDDVDALEALSLVLEEADFDVLRATNGLEALGQLGDRGGQCDLILLDLMMPVMNGWDFRRKQMAIAAFAAIPIVLMSAGARMACVDLGAAGYVAKPVEVSDLLATIAQILVRSVPDRRSLP